VTELDALLAAVAADPADDTRRLALADWAQENDRPDLEREQRPAVELRHVLVAQEDDAPVWRAPPCVSGSGTPPADLTLRRRGLLPDANIGDRVAHGGRVAHGDALLALVLRRRGRSARAAPRMPSPASGQGPRRGPGVVEGVSPGSIRPAGGTPAPRRSREVAPVIAIPLSEFGLMTVAAFHGCAARTVWRWIDGTVSRPSRWARCTSSARRTARRS
jgi:uncharacterized protein (TIGR02996 family)